MNINTVAIEAYENISNWTLGEYKPKTNPISKAKKCLLDKVCQIMDNEVKCFGIQML